MGRGGGGRATRDPVMSRGRAGSRLPLQLVQGPPRRRAHGCRAGAARPPDDLLCGRADGRLGALCHHPPADIRSRPAGRRRNPRACHGRVGRHQVERRSPPHSVGGLQSPAVDCRSGCRTTLGDFSGRWPGSALQRRARREGPISSQPSRTSNRPSSRTAGRHQPPVQPDSSTVPVPGGTSTKYLAGEGWGELAGTTCEAFRGEWHRRWRRPPTPRQLRSLAPIVLDRPKSATEWLAEHQGTKTYAAVEHVFRRHEEAAAAEEDRARQLEADWNATKAEERMRAPTVMRRIGELAQHLAPEEAVTETDNS